MDLKNVYNFERRFNARVRPSFMKVSNPAPLTWQDMTSSDYHSTNYTTETTPAVEILMTEKMFAELLDLSDECNSQEYRHWRYMNSRMGQNWLNNVLNQQDRNQREHYLRSQNPALQNAWEQYQLLLKLVE